MMDIDESRLYDWPIVYILANDSEAYVGQTTSVVRRMSQHGANPEKSAFTTANIIFNEESNMSVITDYESRLIQLMSADGKYALTNKNEGISDSNYFSKLEYDKMFEDLWEELRDKLLAYHTIDEIESSEAFKYSPYKSLNADQETALFSIMSAIRDPKSRQSIVVEGMPGTGKTILAVYLLKALRDMPEYAHLNIRILEPVPSLRGTLRNSLSNIRGLSKNDVIGPNDLVNHRFTNGKEDKPFDILLVDEAHRLKRRKNLASYGSFDKACKALELDTTATQLDWVLVQAKLPIFFYDPMQIVGPSGINSETMEAKLGDAYRHPIKLESQMRVRGGDEYLDYVKSILWNAQPKNQAFDNYEFCLHDDFHEFCECFDQHLAENGLTRMIAGYAWKWTTKKDKAPSAYDICIDGICLKWNQRQDNWVGSGMNDPTAAHEVGVIHTIQGYDLSYAFVVIGEDLYFDEESGRILINRDKYFDKNGRNTATNEELAEYIRNIYYILMTRGIEGTHVYVCDKALRTYLSNYIQKYRNEKP